MRRRAIAHTGEDDEGEAQLCTRKEEEKMTLMIIRETTESLL